MSYLCISSRTMTSSPTTCAKITSWTIIAVLLQITGVILFLIGFFPVKPTLRGFSGPESYEMPSSRSVSNVEEMKLPPDQLKLLYRELSKIPPLYDRLILMVIDGLPAEFVLGRGDMAPSAAMVDAMPYTQFLLLEGAAIAYHAKAAPPTVTMPRLKAMISGAVGGFLDVAFNFNTQAFLDDNLLEQFKRIGWKLVMLGDETWIKLFPTLFDRQDGVSSFYVKDTIEVDFNVTRHLDSELGSSDWNLLILHYLGLDHVGHIGGRHSTLMAPKLREMDEVIKKIHSRIIVNDQETESRTLLVVTSDHGMTDIGNHGGSSYEEVDSLALFIGHGVKNKNNSLNDHNHSSQVDITATLALLFGVPIPKNNIGSMLTRMFDGLTDEQRLRALELNSWQLVRLLHEHLPDFLGGEPSCVDVDDAFQDDRSPSNSKERLWYLFSKATTAKSLWELHQASGFTSNSTFELKVAIQLYDDFLRSTSQWLSQKSTEKPGYLLLAGIVITFISIAILFKLTICLFKEVYLKQLKCCSKLEGSICSWNVDGAFSLVGVVLHALSLGSSSFVEEEQYTWYFLTSTLYLIFVISTIHNHLTKQNSKLSVTTKRKGQPTHKMINDKRAIPWRNSHSSYQISCSLIVLICGRILRGWYQGGVNWVYLPDISKVIIQFGTTTVKAFQIISLFLLLIMSSYAFCIVRSRTYLVHIVRASHILSGLLVCLHIMANQNHEILTMNYSTTLIAQLFYVSAISTVVLTLLAVPWLLPVSCGTDNIVKEHSHTSHLKGIESDTLLFRLQDSLRLIGVTYTVFWCLLQLLLQQPINAIPILLIFLQTMASIILFSATGSNRRQWIEVAAMYFLGLTGYFGLGNTNTLATIDVAGAFIGISSHSTVLSGLLMFSITYAAPILVSLSMVIYISMKDICFSLPKAPGNSTLMLMIGVPCLVPLFFNSIVLISFTITLWLMRNHLFIWSVFSPKYLYICAATVCTYIGVLTIAATGIYTSIVFSLRTKSIHIKDS